MSSTVEFLEVVDRIWRLYQQQGAGNLPASLADELSWRFSLLQNQCDALTERQSAAAETAYKLAERCVRRSEGLNFVTGEAGLIPRRDLIEQLENAIAILRE